LQQQLTADRRIAGVEGWPGAQHRFGARNRSCTHQVTIAQHRLQRVSRALARSSKMPSKARRLGQLAGGRFRRPAGPLRWRSCADKGGKQQYLVSDLAPEASNAASAPDAISASARPKIGNHRLAYGAANAAVLHNLNVARSPDFLTRKNIAIPKYGALRYHVSIMKPTTALRVALHIVQLGRTA
jgi:hypothetical protein